MTFASVYSTVGTEYWSSVFFSGPLGGKLPPLSFEFPPQTITNFVCFLAFSLPTKAIPPPETTSLEKTLLEFAISYEPKR